MSVNMRKSIFKLFPSLENEGIEDQFNDAVQEETGEEGVNIIADSIIESSDTASETVNEFIVKLKETYQYALDDGFEGSFDDFIKSISEKIDSKQSEKIADSVDIISDDEPVSDSEAQAEEVDNTDVKIESDAAKEVVEESDSQDSLDVESSSDSEVLDDVDLVEDNVEDEEVEEEVEEVVDDPEDTDSETLTEYIEDVDESEPSEDMSEMVDEAIDSSDRLGQIAKLVKEEIEKQEADGEEPSEELEKAVDLAVESYAKKFGLEKEVLYFSTESKSSVEKLKVKQKRINFLKNIIDDSIEKYDHRFKK